MGLVVYRWALPRISSVALATRPVHRLQLRQIVHNQGASPTTPPSYIWVKGKGWILILRSSTYMVDHEQHALTISEVAVDWQEPVVLQHKCSHPLPALTDIWTRGSSYQAHHRPNQPHQAFTP